MTARPVVMSVDDDPSVSRAVARDLRRHLGDDYRVVRAESGPDALEALRELTMRGESTALLLADHRMPGMTGVEFLEQAMDLVPEARRVLLTAYADTDAAIRAINDVDLDRYLLKPWDPPEEHLYPVLDELLTEWRSRAAAGVRGTDAGGAPVVGADAGRQGVSRAQPGALPPPRRAQRRRATPAGRGTAGAGCRRVARGVPARRRRASSSDREGAGRAGRVVDHGRQPVLRRRGRRRRAGRSRVPRCTPAARGCARCSSRRRPPVARPASPAASRTTWASRAGSPAPNWRNAPATRLSASGSRSLTAAEVHRHPAAGRRAVVRFADGNGGHGPRGRPGHRGVVHAAARTRRRRAGRPRRLLRGGGARGGELPRPGRPHRRRGQLRRAGGAALRQVRRSGGHAGPRGLPAPSCRTTWFGASRRRPHQVRTCTEIVGGGGDEHLEHLVLQDAKRGSVSRSRRTGCSSSSARSRRPSGSATPSPATDGASC